jgi:hypothetical protein
MTAVVGARKLSKVYGDVVQALMQARYQNSSRGQFISEDPIFLGNPAKQNLNNPQTLDYYPYGTTRSSRKDALEMPSQKFRRLLTQPFETPRQLIK